MTSTVVRPVTRRDAEAWLRLRSGLWPDASEAEHRVEIEAFLAGHSREPLAVLVAAERWAREQGCTEFASDAKPDNELSTRAHHALGFEDAGLIRCFRKSLAGRL